MNYKIGNDSFMEIKKIILYFCLGCFLTGCMQSTAMLGPGLTFAGTGNMSQASISYFTSNILLILFFRPVKYLNYQNCKLLEHC